MEKIPEWQLFIWG